MKNNLKDLAMINKNMAKHRNDNDSIVVREPGLINGEVNTVNETNSAGGIMSFKNVNKDKQNVNNAKRESIYKYVLMKDNPMNDKEKDNAPNK
jgi:hypothetical protein